jgi:hypothetical protein
MSRWSSGSTAPTPTVIAESPWKPPTIAPQSMETMSPSFSTPLGLGIPCTISSLIEVHSVAGKPR